MKEAGVARLVFFDGFVACKVDASVRTNGVAVFAGKRIGMRMISQGVESHGQ